jgi:type I restriction enzyme M protein
MIRITQQQLESYLWGAAVLLRGTIDAGDYKQFIFPLLFFKRLCDVFDEETVTALRDSGGDQDFAHFPENHRFQVPPDAHWREIRKVNRDVGRALQQAMRAIEVANQDKLMGIFGDAQWTNKDRLSDAMLRDLVEHFSTLELTVANLPEDELGQGYEYLIKKFADDSGHTAAEFYTNRTVVHLMTEMLDVQSGESVYDPTCGSGGMLLSCIAHLRRAGKEWRNVKLFGQERNLMTSSIARMNCFLHGIEDFRIERGDTLAEPKLVEGDRLQRFDVVLANPPYSIKQWNREAFAADPWGRNVFGVPPQGRADYAFQQHILQSLKSKSGRCAVLWPHGVLFRDDEAAVRRKMIEADLIECVVGLGPNLFYNSSMPSCIVICRTQKAKERRKKILFINAVNEVTRERAQSFLTDEHQTHIASAYHSFQNEEGFAKVATVDEIRGNDFSLRMGFYVPLKTGATGDDANGDGLTAKLTSWGDSVVSVRGTLRAILGAHTQSTPQFFKIHPHAAKVLTGNFDRSKWMRVRFGDVVNKISDRIETTTSRLRHYIGGEHFDNGTIRFTRKGVIEGSTIGPAFHMRFKPGHVLYMSRNPHLRKASMVDFEGICANTSYVCETVSDKLLQELLPFVMQSNAFWNWGSENKRGSTNPYLNWKDIASFEFDLPPLDQQRRIAEILWAVDEVAKGDWISRESILALRKAAHREVFVSGLKKIGATTNHGYLPAGWRETTVGEACIIENRLRKPINATERAMMQGEYPYYGPTGILDYLNEYRAEGEYVLIGEDGDHFLKFDSWNMTHLVKGRFNVNNHAHLLRGTDNCRTEWIFQYFKHRDITPFLSRQGSGRLKMQKSVLERMPFVVPPVKEQDEILDFLRRLDASFDRINEHSAKTSSMLAALTNELLGQQ